MNPNRPRIPFRSALLFLLLALGTLLGARGPVVILSLDGVRADSFTPASMPRLWKLSEQGLRGEGLPPFPSTTFACHAALATGCWTEHHGIVANAFLDPELGLVARANAAAHLQREPLWAAAARQGLRCAVYHWPHATGPWGGSLPWRLQPYRSGRAEKEALAFVDDALAQGAQLVMAYLSGTDSEGHARGPASPAVRAKLAALDALLGPRLKTWMARHPGLRVILSADHGMAATRGRVHLPSLLPGGGQRFVVHGGSAYIYTQDPGQAEAARARLLAAGLQGVRVWRREELPEAYHLKGSPRIAPLVLEGEEGTWFAGAEGAAEEAQESRWRRGAHGYPERIGAMRTLLVVLGTGRAGALPPMPLWDLAPTAARWLGISFREAPDGEARPELEAGSGSRAVPGR